VSHFVKNGKCLIALFRPKQIDKQQTHKLLSNLVTLLPNTGIAV